MLKLRPKVHPSDFSDPVVTILLRNLNQYRLSFYQLLRTELARDGVHLRLVTASGLSEDVEKGDTAELEWSEYRALKEWKVKGTSLLWQQGFDLARDSDLIITEQASKQLFNILLTYGQGLFKTRHAFWGHGRNFQATHESETARGEGLKRRLTERTHWFFSYNDLSSRAAIDAGMQEERVTPIMNSTDTERIRTLVADLDPDEVRPKYGFGDGPLALYMGGIASKKRPEFLIDSAIEIRRLLPEFELVIIGDGPMRDIVKSAADEHPWIHWLGAIYDDTRIGPASVCSLQLLPGLVGLNVVDAFALGIPTVTVDLDFHSPEIDYLKHDVNGIILPNETSSHDYAQAVANLLQDRSKLEQLRSGAEQWGKKLSTQDMVERFVAGVHAALAADPRQSSGR